MIPAGFPALRLLARLPLGPAFPSPSTPEWQGVVRVLGLAKGFRANDPLVRQD